MDNKLEILDLAIAKIQSKENKIMFYVPTMNEYIASVGVTYSHAKNLNDLGYNVIIIHDDDKYVYPEWLGNEYEELKHVGLHTKELRVAIEDVLVYPEGFPDMMEKTRELSCFKIILCQSHINVLGSLTPGLSWNNFDIDRVIVTQKPLKDYLIKVFGEGNLLIDVIPVSVDDDTFKYDGRFKKPIVAVSAREQVDVLNVAKQFYSTYPQYRMLSFKDMRGMSREDFSKTLNDSFLGVWLDRDAGFGTFPIECAKTSTPYIALIPDMVPEYAKDENGIWVYSQLDIPDLIAQALEVFLNNEDMSTIDLSELKEQYTKEEECKKIAEVYAKYLAQRVNEFETLKNKLNKND